MKRSLPILLKRWLDNNEGWHNKAKITRMEWRYEGSHKTYSTDTVGRALREASEGNLILKRETERGQVEYSSKPRQQYVINEKTRTAHLV